MKKLSFLLLFTMLTTASWGQTSTESDSYAMDKFIEKCTDVPVLRQINGGTVFKVTYEPEELWDNSMRGAFEYACKIWEEQLPNSLPINICAKIGNIRGTDNMKLLSRVQSTTYDINNHETVLSSRMKYVLLAEYNSGYNTTYLERVTDVDFFNKPDIVITYNMSMLNDFSYSLDNTPVNKYDFVTIVLRDIARGLGFSFNMTANSQKQTLEDTNRPLTYYESIVRQAIGGDNLSEAYTNATQGSLTVSVDYYGSMLHLYAPTTWQNGISLNYLIPEESKNFTELLSYNFGKGSVVRNIVDNYKNIFHDFQGWKRYNITTGYSPVSVSSDGSSGNIVTYNGDITIRDNSHNQYNISQKVNTIQYPPLKYEQTSNANVFDLESYLFPYNYRYPDKSGPGDWLISLLKKDGTWDLVYRQSSGGFNIPLETRMADWNISSNFEQYQRTCDGYIRCRITRYEEVYDYLYHRPYYIIKNHYYVLDYLPQKVKMRYLAPIQASSAFAKPSINNDYRQDITISIKNLEGVNRIVVEQLEEGNDLPIKYEVKDFQKGYFVANVDKELKTEFVAYSYNNNGSSKSETLIVPPLVSYDFIVDFSNENILINNNLQKKPVSINYNIYSVSPSSLRNVKRGVLNHHGSTIQISDLSNGSYILDISSGNKRKSVKFVK
ncbi:hypothetical protein ACQRD6_10390 [Prevotella sp. SGI.027]